jgi:F-type H+-transporting ATPase subunit a
MNFEHVLAHHLIDHKLFHFWIGPVDMGLSPLIVSMWLAGLLLTAFTAFAARSQTSAGRLSRSMIEPVILFLRDDNLKPLFGDHTDHFLPYFMTLFAFLLGLNLFGLVPFTSGTTSNIAIPAAMAVTTLFMIFAVGIKEQGFFSYFKHLAPSGIPWPVLIILFPIELIGIFAKCFSLCIRLFANMIAGHVVSLSFLFLIFVFAKMSHVVGAAAAPGAVGLALFAYLLDVLVAFLQAYIFMILTAVFVSMSVHPH